MKGGRENCVCNIDPYTFKKTYITINTPQKVPVAAITALNNLIKSESAEDLMKRIIGEALDEEAPNLDPEQKEQVLNDIMQIPAVNYPINFYDQKVKANMWRKVRDVGKGIIGVIPEIGDAIDVAVDAATIGYKAEQLAKEFQEIKSTIKNAIPGAIKNKSGTAANNSGTAANNSGQSSNKIIDGIQQVNDMTDSLAGAVQHGKNLSNSLKGSDAHEQHPSAHKSAHEQHPSAHESAPAHPPAHPHEHKSAHAHKSAHGGKSKRKTKRKTNRKSRMKTNRKSRMKTRMKSRMKTNRKSRMKSRMKTKRKSRMKSRMKTKRITYKRNRRSF
jgi:hypothetical protein